MHPVNPLCGNACLPLEQDRIQDSDGLPGQAALNARNGTCRKCQTKIRKWAREDMSSFKHGTRSHSSKCQLQTTHREPREAFHKQMRLEIMAWMAPILLWSI